MNEKVVKVKIVKAKNVKGKVARVVKEKLLIDKAPKVVNEGRKREEGESRKEKG